MNKPILVALLLLLALVVAWHFFYPLSVGVVALTGGLWAFVVVSIVMFCVLLLLLFIFTGLGLFILGALASAWAMVAFFMFPFLFPILIPLLITILVISYIRHRQTHKQKNLPPQ